MPDAHVIFAGTSNPLGYLNNGPAPYTPTARVQIWADTNADGVGDAWNYMAPGTNTGTLNNPSAWGGEVALANDWLAANPSGYLWIVKGTETVKGSTTLAVDWSPVSGAMYASTKHAVSAAMANLSGTGFAFTHYDAAFIGLGENDAVVPAYATAYATNIAAFNTAVRLDWHVTDLIEYRITDGPGAAADNLAVRQAQWNVDQTDPDLVTFKTIGFSMQPDAIHYDATGHTQIGHGCYDAWVL